MINISRATTGRYLDTVAIAWGLRRRFWGWEPNWMLRARITKIVKGKYP